MYISRRAPDSTAVMPVHVARADYTVDSKNIGTFMTTIITYLLGFRYVLTKLNCINLCMYVHTYINEFHRNITREMI